MALITLQYYSVFRSVVDGQRGARAERERRRRGEERRPALAALPPARRLRHGGQCLANLCHTGIHDNENQYTYCQICRGVTKIQTK